MLKLILSDKLYRLLFVLASLVYLIGLFYVPLMDVDATQYASISLEMLRNGDFWHVFNHQKDYLDKPPLIFWLGSLSYKLFGVHPWSYRLPSFLFSLLGVYATFRLGKLLYRDDVGLKAALMLYTSQAMFLMNHDVRTDTILTATIIFSTWQLAAFLQSGKFQNIVLGFMGLGLGMLEKGPLGLVVPALAIGTHILVRRDFRDILRWQWLAGLLITSVMLIPMCIGLYEQFDLHPEKLVNERHGVSGLRFFFWEQSFGRITGENVWKDDSTVLFFTHTFIWSFLPWSILATIAFFSRAISLVRLKFKSHNMEFMSFGGFLLPFVALSLSHYKLPHYVFVLYPFAALFTAAWLSEIEARGAGSLKNYWRVQFWVSLLIIILGLLINFWFFPITRSPLSLLAAILLLLVGFYFFLFKASEVSRKVYTFSAFAGILLNFLLNANFYPQLLKYQGGYAASEYLSGKAINQDNCFSLNETSFALDVNTGFNWIDGTPERIEYKIREQPELWIFTTHDGYTFLKERYTILEFKSFEHFHVTELTLPFLNPASRPGVLGERCLVRIAPKK
ncbi:MAG TPA: glycosyltransferase family 39 protein [Bacteroidia bacterium]|nr:glycosyltransferase family 39 protein [Bacteroidia bacterium]